jgi:hypothetical protein
MIGSDMNKDFNAGQCDREKRHFLKKHRTQEQLTAVLENGILGMG